MKTIKDLTDQELNDLIKQFEEYDDNTFVSTLKQLEEEQKSREIKRCDEELHQARKRFVNKNVLKAYGLIDKYIKVLDSVFDRKYQVIGVAIESEKIDLKVLKPNCDIPLYIVYSPETIPVKEITKEEYIGKTEDNGVQTEVNNFKIKNNQKKDESFTFENGKCYHIKYSDNLHDCTDAYYKVENNRVYFILKYGYIATVYRQGSFDFNETSLIRINSKNWEEISHEEYEKVEKEYDVYRQHMWSTSLIDKLFNFPF